MRGGYEMQMGKIARLAKERTLSVATLEEAGLWLRRHYALTPPTATSALGDYSPRNAKTLWYNSRFYRANLYWESGRFRFRDIQVYDETRRSPYLDRAGTSTQVHYYALPVVDGCLWSDSTCAAGLRILSRDAGSTRGEYAEIECTRQDIRTSGKAAIATLTDSHGHKYAITLREKEIEVAALTRGSDYCIELTGVAAKMPGISISPKEAEYTGADGAHYAARLSKGSFGGSPQRWRIVPQKGLVRMRLSQRE